MRGRSFVLLLCGAILLGLAALVAVPVWVLRTASPVIAIAPLVRDLPPGSTESRRAFRARVTDAFPPGSSEADLLERLRAEGVTRRIYGEGNPPKTPWAFFEVPRSGCVVTWRARWQARDGRIVSAVGDRDPACR